MTDYKTRPPTAIHQDSAATYQWLRTTPLAILCGRNNTGKTYVLRRLIEDVGIKASYLGPARFANFNLLTPFSPQPNRKEEQWRNFLRQLQEETQNIDNSPLNLQQAIAELSDT